MRDVIGAGLLLAGLLLMLASVATAPQPASAAVYAPVAAPRRPAPAPETERGRLLLQAKGCVGCHEVSHLGLRPPVGFVGIPDLSKTRDVAAARKPGLTADGYVRESILAPSAFIVPGTERFLGMPVLGLSEAEVDEILRVLLGPR
ncbi:MAG TPA: hypothetical protein VFM93_01995 [Candidatus Limnocylindria bacterium]|nr:hypothetical protein [Candidatus Limnocylindria bacterium]